MKLFAFLKNAENSQRIIGAVLALCLLVVCLSGGLIAVLNSPSVYMNNFQQRLPQDYEIDNDNFIAFYTTLIDVISTHNSELLHAATFSVNGIVQPIFVQDDIPVLLAAASTARVAYICMYIGLVAMVAIMIVCAIRKGKIYIQRTSQLALFFFVALVLLSAIIVGIIILCMPQQPVDSFFTLLLGNSFTAYSTGNLANLFNMEMQTIFANAVLRMIGFFSVIGCAVLYLFTRLGKKSVYQTIDEDYLYQ